MPLSSKTGSRYMTRLLKEIDNDDFDGFVHRMFHDNCAEREAMNLPLYSFDEYLTKNETFLIEKWDDRHRYKPRS